MKKGLHFCTNSKVCLGTDTELEEYGIHRVIDRYMTNYIYFRCTMDLNIHSRVNLKVLVNGNQKATTLHTSKQISSSIKPVN